MKRWYRSQSDRKVAGIFGGLGELYDIDPNILRLVAVLLFLVSGFFPMFFTYIIAWIILPDGKPQTSRAEETGNPAPVKKSSKTSRRSSG